MQYVFANPIPVPWLLADLATVVLTLILALFALRRTAHPAAVLLEGTAFVCLFAGLFENFAVVNGWYVYGRSLLMFGDVPLAVPLIELDVFLGGLWLLERMRVPVWCRPLILGLFGMLQDFSLDPLAARQVFASAGITSGRWTWLLPAGAVNIFGIPIYNFPGWMLIMLYGSAYVLMGRKLYKDSGYRTWIGYVYPFGAMLLAMITLVTPLSQFLLWLAPLGAKGGPAEWIMLAFFLTAPVLLLLLVWRGKMTGGFDPAADWPIFAVPVLFHLADIAGTIAAGLTGILWLVLFASCVHILLLAWIFLAGRRSPAGRSASPAFSP
jgi:hypothetical protein